MASDLFVLCLKAIFLQFLLTSSLFLLHRRGLQTCGLPGSAIKRRTGQPSGGSTTLSSSHIFDRAAHRESSLLIKPVPVAGTTLLCGVSPDFPRLVILAAKSCVRYNVPDFSVQCGLIWWPISLSGAVTLTIVAEPAYSLCHVTRSAFWSLDLVGPLPA